MRRLLAATFLAALVAACNPSAKEGFVEHPTPGQVAAASPAVNGICPVSRDSIGSMGEGATVIWKGRAVRLCCAGCVKTFAKDPGKFAALAARP